MYMSWRQVKRVSPSEVAIGDIVDSYIQDGCHHTVSDGWIVVDKAGAFVVLQYRRGEPTRTSLSTDGLMFETPMTEKEYRDKYEPTARELIRVLTSDPLPSQSWDSHTLDNSWTDVDVWDFAANCTENHIQVLGWFPLEQSKQTWAGDSLDIGIVAKDLETEDDVFWVHYKMEWVEDMVEHYDAVKAREEN